MSSSHLIAEKLAAAQRTNPWTHARIRIRMLLVFCERLEAARRLRLHEYFCMA